MYTKQQTVVLNHSQACLAHCHWLLSGNERKMICCFTCNSIITIYVLIDSISCGCTLTYIFSYTYTDSRVRLMVVVWCIVWCVVYISRSDREKTRWGNDIDGTTLWCWRTQTYQKKMPIREKGDSYNDWMITAKHAMYNIDEDENEGNRFCSISRTVQKLKCIYTRISTHVQYIPAQSASPTHGDRSRVRERMNKGERQN